MPKLTVRAEKCSLVEDQGWFIFFGWISDRVGRRLPILVGYTCTLLLLFPIFWLMGSAANPDLARAAERAPVIVAGPHCSYDPFAAKQKDECGRLLDYFSKKGVSYTKAEAPFVAVTIGGIPQEDLTPAVLDKQLADAGYNLEKVVPSGRNILLILLGVFALGALSGSTYGSVAALLCELFPPQIRYSSMSIPYHIGAGYFGGFLPFISQYIVARTGNPYAGLWYTFAVTLVALLVTLFVLRERDLIKD